MTTLRSEPFRKELSLRNAMNQLFEQSFVRPALGNGGSQAYVPLMDVLETEHGYQVRVLLPGVTPEDIHLEVAQNTLILKGQFSPWVQQDHKVNWLVQEISAGSFERSITFPQPIDAEKITTSYEHGVLTLSVPVSEASRPKRIRVTGSQSQLKMAQPVTH
ncbi:MAG: Hsp20/alpha crystallin family protein [Ktedonobacteraceae bacterium]